MILKQPKEKVKTNLMNNIKEIAKNKKKSKIKNDNLNKDKSNNYIEIKNNNNININKNEINNYNNHYYLYINNLKEKDKKKENNNNVNATYINKDEVISNNCKYKIEKIKYSNKDEKNNISNSNSNNVNSIKIENLNNNEENYSLNNFDFNFLNEKIETIRERLNSINVIDALSELAGLQSFKEQKNNDDELYDKSKKLNKEFYDNLDINFNKIEEFLDNL